MGNRLWIDKENLTLSDFTSPCSVAVAGYTLKRFVLTKHWKTATLKSSAFPGTEAHKTYREE